MPAAIPLVAVVASGIASAVVGGGIVGALVGAGAALVVTAVGGTIFPAKKPSAPTTPATTGFDASAPGAGRTQSFRQPITEHQIVFGRCKVSGPIVFLHSATDDQGRADGYFYAVVVLAAHQVRAIGDVWLGDAVETDAKYAGLVRVDRHLGTPDQMANANLVAETGGKWTAAHRGRGRAYIAVRLKITAEAFPSGPPNIAAMVEGADTILDPRTGATGWSDNPALCLAWYLTAPFGWRASWADIDIPALIAAANVCDELVGTRRGVTERRYTCNGRVSLGEGKLAITRKLVSAMAGALVVSGGRFFIHAGAPALPAATLTSDDLRGDVTIQGSRPRRDLFNGVRAVYVEPAANWQPTDAPPLLASNYVAEDGGEAIYRDMEFPLTTSVSTVQRIMKAELERNRRQREVAFPANLSALRLRPWEGAMVALDRLVPFPARVTGWSLSPDGGVNLTLAEEDAAVWDWDPAVDERATGESPSVVLPNPGVIAAPATITVTTPTTTSFAALAVSWAAVPSAHLAGYEVEFLPASVAVWQGYGAGLGATAAAIPTAEPTAFRARAVARSGAVSGWREALVPGTVSAPTATGIAGGIRLSGGVPADAVRLQVFEAASNSLAAAAKLPTEPTSLFFDRTGLTAGQTRWYWLRAVSAEGNVSALAGPVSATALRSGGAMPARIDDLMVLGQNISKTDLAKYLRDREAVLPRDFGGLGDGAANDRAAIQACFDRAAADGKFAVIPPGTWNVDAGVTLGGGARGLIMQGVIQYTGAANAPATVLTLGDGGTTRNGEKLYLNLQVTRQIQSDWLNEADIGILARNLDSSTLDLRLVSGFTIGLRTLGDRRGFEDTTLILGRILNNRYGLDAHCATATAWNTSIRYYGGHFACATGINPTMDRYGVRFSRGSADAYNNHNRHVFDAPNFELRQLDPNVAIPFLNQTNGTAIIARGIRMEACSPVVAHHTGTATDCEFEVAWANTYGVRMDYGPTATRAGNAVLNRHRAPASRLTRLLANIPNLRAAAFRDSASFIGVEGAVVIATSTTAETSMAALSWNGLDGIAATGRGLLLNANRGTAFVVQTTHAKEFALAHWLVGGADGGRLYVRCFDGAGNVREDQPQDVLASGTTMQWDAPSKGWNAGSVMQDSLLNRRQTIRLGAGVAFAQIGVIGFDGQIEIEALRLYGLPEDAPAILYGCPSVPAGARQIAVETTWDLPNLGPGATSLLDVTVPGARQGDLAAATLLSSTRFLELSAVAWTNDTVRVMARNISLSATFDLGPATLSVQVTKRRVP